MRKKIVLILGLLITEAVVLIGNLLLGCSLGGFSCSGFLTTAPRYISILFDLVSIISFLIPVIVVIIFFKKRK